MFSPNLEDGPKARKKQKQSHEIKDVADQRDDELAR